MMDKIKLILDLAQKLLKVVSDLRALADSMQAVCDTLTEGLSEEKKSAEPQQEPAIPLEKVRGVLAEKSRAGFTEEVREIIRRHGADRLSGIAPEEYRAVIEEAEALK